MSMAKYHLGLGDGTCSCRECKITPEKQIETLQKRVASLEKERASKYLDLVKHFERAVKLEVKEQVSAIKLTNREADKLKKFIKKGMPKEKMAWAIKVWAEVDNEDFQQILEEYEG